MRRIKRKEVIETFRDGREVINLRSVKGRQIYRIRIETMASRQGWICCLADYCPTCPGSLRGREITFEHEHGRGMGGGKRDDRITLPDGNWQNGAAHLLCNTWKGSRYIDYNATRNAKLTTSQPAEQE